MNQSLKRITDLAALMVVTIWGVNFVFLKAALSEFDPLVFTWLRFAGMLVIGWSLLLAQHRAGKHGGALKIARADIPGFILSGVTGFTLYIVLSIIGLNYTTAFSNALLLAISPLFVALLLSAQRLERVRGGQWLAMGVSLGGVCIFLADKLQFGLVAASAGDLISLAAAFCWAAYNVVNKPLLARYSSITVTTLGLTFGAIPVMILALPALFAQDWLKVSAAGWGTLVWSAIFPVYFAWTVWGWVNARARVSRTSLYLYLVPLIGGVTSWLLLDEGFGAQKTIGSAIILAGLVIARYFARQSAARQAPERSRLHIQGTERTGESL